MFYFPLSYTIIVVFFTVQLAAFGPNFDYSKIRYCKKTKRCPGRFRNIGCRCFWNPRVEEIAMDAEAFRQTVLDAHNDLRQYIASGDEKNRSTGPAANMNVLNYDLELEYLARCWVASRDYGPSGSCEPDPCHRSSTFGISAGQNMISTDKIRNVEPSVLRAFVQRWYDEVVLISPTLIDRLRTKDLNTPYYEQIVHFTQVVYATATHVGCAWGRRENPQKKDT